MNIPDESGSRPVPTPDDEETAEEVALLWGFENNPAFKGTIAMACARARQAGRTEKT